MTGYTSGPALRSGGDPGRPSIRVLVSAGQRETGGALSDSRPLEVADLAELKEVLHRSSVFPWRDAALGLSSPLRQEPGESAFVWIDLKRGAQDMTKELLSWLPVHVLTEKTVLERSAVERLEHFPSHGYTFLTLTARRRGAAIPRGVDEPMVIVSVIAFDAAIVTISTDDFEGEERIDFHVVREAVSPFDGTSCSGVSTIFSSLVSAVTQKMLTGVPTVLIEADQLDELVLQIVPSEVDQADVLLRIKEMRHKLAKYHIDLLVKERVLKQLLLPMMHQTAVCLDARTVQRYQRCLTLTRSSIEKLRKGRDVVNLSSMTLVSGVSARLVQHCHFMDYMNNVQSQVALVVMPICVIPGLWAMNVSVPFETSTTMTAFWCLVAITLSLLVLGLIYPLSRYFMYKPPGALVPSLD